MSIIQSIALLSYRLPLIRPLQLMGVTIRERAGILLRISDSSGNSGIGEVAPFPGLHRESYEDARKQLIAFKQSWTKKAMPQNLLPLKDGFEKWLGEEQFSPSVRYGIELAVLNLIAKQQGKSLADLLGENPRQVVSLNGLIAGALNEMDDQLAQLVHEGFHRIKIKVARKKISEEIEFVQAVNRQLPADVMIRLDANRRWSLQDAIAFGKGVADCRIEYIEEPVSAPEAIPDFYEACKLPVALDESLDDCPVDQITWSPAIRALVIKPSVIGSIEKTIQLGNLARERNTLSVISCAFYSGVGLAAAASVASVLNDQDVPCGLGTYKWLQEDVSQPAFRTVKGKIDVKKVWKHCQNIRPQFNWD